MSETAEKSYDEKYCVECGSVIKSKAEICPKCGVRQFAQSASLSLGAVSPNGKSKIGAALFAFFLGGFGAHKFYLGKVGLGFLYLLFCWTLIPCIVAFIEAILFLTMSDESFIEKYGQI